MTTYTRPTPRTDPTHHGTSPAWHQEADAHRPTQPSRLIRIDLGGDGYIDFVDERAAHPDGEVVVVAVGRQAAERAGFFIKNAGATPHELFMALAPAHQAAPLRLLEDHVNRAANEHGVSREPRALSRSSVFRNYTGPTYGRTTFYEIHAATCEEDFLGCGYPSSFFNHWALYDTGAVEDLVEWSSGYAFIANVTQRALGLTYYPEDSGDGGLINVWIESGIGGWYPTIWSATLAPEQFVWFRTGNYLGTGISHLHWSDLEPGTGHVRLIGTWSDY